MVSRPAPLTGVTVVDLTQVLAGPYCTYQLALLGAKVIKIEPPGGELTRMGGALSELSNQNIGLSFCTQNADKDCVELDLKQSENVSKVLGLISTADVFVQNYRPGVADRLGFSVESVREVNPKIVYCSISAYGGEGPIGHRPAYDHVVQAMSGIMSTTGPDDAGPIKVGAPYIDYATGLNAAFAIMAGLRERDRTDDFQLVDVAMLDTALNLMASNVVATANTGVDLPKLGNEAASRAPSSGCFVTADGSLIMLAANNERQFDLLCSVLGHSDWAKDPRWENPSVRSKNQDALRDELDRVFLTRTAKEWETLLDVVGVPSSRVRKLGELIGEGQPDARGLLGKVRVGENQTPVQLPAIGFRLNGDSLKPLNAPKTLGEDTDVYI
ncbi:CoA transferase [Gammaproteobacteria bacterium]|nr:CoA transferase [Gammaproteobacteria bacterium]